MTGEILVWNKFTRVLNLFLKD